MEVIESITAYDLDNLQIGDKIKIGTFWYKVDNVVKEYKDEEGLTLYELYGAFTPVDKMTYRTGMKHIHIHDMNYYNKWWITMFDDIQILKCDD